MKPLLLSICIATYNRARFIGTTLDSIIPQLTDETEILVVDGASTDDTESVMTEYSNTCSRLRYVRLSAKGGVDQDYNKTVELAEGEMCWLFTDDDLLKPGAVARVLEAIRHGNDLIVVNAEIRNRDLTGILQSQRLIADKDRIYSPDEMEKLFIDTVVYLSFIGAVVIRRSVWMNRVRDKYYGTEFIHIGVIFQKHLSASAFLISEPYISIRYENAQWESRRFTIWMFKWPKLLWSFDTVSADAKQKITPLEPWRSYRTLIVRRSDGEYSSTVFRQVLSGQKAGSSWKIGAYIISLLPKRPILFVRKLYKVVKV